jgi:hypothetical protein
LGVAFFGLRNHKKEKKRKKPQNPVLLRFATLVLVLTRRETERERKRPKHE